MNHVRLLAAGLVLVVGPAMASAQPAAFAQATQSLVQSADTRDSNGFAEAWRRMQAALSEWDHQLTAQEARVEREVTDAPAARQSLLHVELGLALRLRGRIDDALREFDAAAQIQPESSQVQLLRGLTLQVSARSAEAARAFRVAWAHDPGNTVAAYYLLRHADGTAPDEDGHARQALIRAYETIRTTTTTPASPPFASLDAVSDAQTPVVGNARTGPGFALIAAAKYTEAVASLSTGAGDFTTPVDGPLARFIQAQVDEKENRVSEARDGYTAALAGALTGRSVIYVAIGRLAEVEGDGPAAIDAFEHAVRLNPNEPLMRQELATALAAAGRRDAAFAELVAGLLVNPANAPLHAAIGQLRLDDNAPADAVPAFTRALELSPERYEVRYALAIALKRLGRNDDAALQLEQFERTRRQMLERRRRDIQSDVDKEETIRRGVSGNPGGTP